MYVYFLFRADCNCQPAMVSSIFKEPILEEHSDCISRVPYVDGNDTLPLHLFIKRGQEKLQTRFKFSMIEVNNRFDFFLSPNNTTTHLSSVDNNTITFKGSGLYHFKVEMSEDGYSFCDLSTGFAVYVRKAQMLRLTECLVYTMTVYFFALVLLAVFLVAVYRDS